MDFHHYIKAVGTGKKHNRNLTEEEAFDAMDQMLNLKPYPEQISAFLLGWRVNVESVEEFSGALRAIEQDVVKRPIPNAIEIGYPYDGKVNNPYLFSLVAKLLKPFDLHVIISGDLLQPAKGGVVTKEICESIILEDNVHFFDRKTFAPKLHRLNEIRRRLGLRTGLNTIEKLTNPAQAKYGLIGAFHKPFVQKYAKVFGPRYEKLIVVQGNEGTPEVFSKCKYWICEDGSVSEHYINPSDFGIVYQKSWDRITLEASLEAIQEPSEEFLKLAKLNAALYLLITGHVGSVEEGWEMLA
ncbi:MAG: glycosyl transferase [Epsilonproteobacteria bacterium]|nr:glycosyl transferase [Campylobacterota bacterium]